MTMSDTQVKIIKAAIAVFTRYGGRRSSMSDVAQQAGVSRQTLYGNFKSKDELMAAAMTHSVDMILEAVSNDWAACTSLSDILDVYFKNAVLQPFEVMQNMPDLVDLMRGVGDTFTKVSRAADAKKGAKLAAKLEQYASKLETSGSDPRSVAELVVRSTTEFKYSASSEEGLKRLLATLKVAVLALAA